MGPEEESKRDSEVDRPLHLKFRTKFGKRLIDEWSVLPGAAKSTILKIVRWVVIGLVALFLLNLAFSIQNKIRQRRALDASLIAGRTVKVARPELSEKTFTIQLPGTTQAFNQATLYARTNGYLKVRNVDIGDKVKGGQILAVIEAPDLDAQLIQAKAQVEQNRAALALAKVTFVRQKELLQTKVISKQDYDQAEATYNQSIANLDAALANVANLQAQTSFEQIVAPFNGTITARYLDIGALISIGTSTTSSPSIFQIANTDVLRVFMYVPQAYVNDLKLGDSVKLIVPEYPQEQFTGKITRYADALDPSARTEQVEVDISNEDGRLKPGMYLNAVFTVGQQIPAYLVPSAVLRIDARGIRIATVQPNRRIQFVTVVLGRDFGKNIEVLDGLKGNEEMVINPNADLRNGELANVMSDKK